MQVRYYRLIFLLGFVLIPSAIWGIQVRPDWEARDTYLQRQNSAILIQEQNSLLTGQRDQLSELWHNFLPVAEEALENLEQDLNPHLVQKRIDRAAAELNCDVQITPKNNSHNDNFARFLLNGTGRYSDLVKLIDRLEQGQHYVRFEKLAFVMPSLDYSEAETGAVRITGAIMVPILEDYNQQEGI